MFHDEWTKSSVYTGRRTQGYERRVGIEEKGRLVKYDILRNVNTSSEKVETCVVMKMQVSEPEIRQANTTNNAQEIVIELEAILFYIFFENVSLCIGQVWLIYL